MLFPESFPVGPDSLCFIEFRSVSLPLFSIGIPPLVRKDRIRRAPRELDFMPILYERRTPAWYDGKRDEDPVHELLLFFDMDEYDIDTFGHFYGDTGIEAMIAGHLAPVLPPEFFGGPEYTTIGEQADDYLSLRFNAGDGRGLSRYLRKDPAIIGAIEKSPLVVKSQLITPFTAERYRQATDPNTPEDMRASVPRGLGAGLRIGR